MAYKKHHASKRKVSGAPSRVEPSHPEESWRLHNGKRKDMKDPLPKGPVYEEHEGYRMGGEFDAKFGTEMNEYANIHQGVKHSKWSPNPSGLNEYYDDTFAGVQDQLGNEHKGLKKQFMPKKI